MDIESLRKQALEEFERIRELAHLEEWRIKFLGRKSQLSRFLRSLADRTLEERRELGSRGNALRRELEELYRATEKKLMAMRKDAGRAFDVSRPGKKFIRGHIHPLTLIMERALDFFDSIGFSVEEGPEIETEYHNFDALNIPPWHPARDLMDTFWLALHHARAGRLLLRTHTSPVQIRYMETHQPPFRIVAAGRVFRHEATDARHEAEFHQLEGLMVGSDVSFANFKYVITEFFKAMFGPATLIRLKQSYFPFVEPGVEVYMQCVCKGKNARCGVCGGSGWLEMAGAGMVHPNVFRAVGYDPNRVQGFAFGMGVERLAMIKYKIDDIRLFHSGDLRFIKQF